MAPPAIERLLGNVVVEPRRERESETTLPVFTVACVTGVVCFESYYVRTTTSVRARSPEPEARGGPRGAEVAHSSHSDSHRGENSNREP